MSDALPRTGLRDRVVVGIANRILRLASPRYRERLELIVGLGCDDYVRKIAADQEHTEADQGGA